jgi:hypothetical protein
MFRRREAQRSEVSARRRSREKAGFKQAERLQVRATHISLRGKRLHGEFPREVHSPAMDAFHPKRPHALDASLRIIFWIPVSVANAGVRDERSGN